MTDLPPEFPEDDGTTTLLPCIICNRTFNPKALERHSKVCEKLSTKKRKVRKTFNSTKQRQEGTDIGTVPLTSLDKPIPKPKNRWREKHKEFLRAIRAAKGLEVDEGDDAHGSNSSSVPSDYIQCQYCHRHFGPKAADRHISWCREQRSRLPRSPAPSAATERLKNRTKYIPPKPGQNGWRAPKKRDVISSIPPPSASSASHPTLNAPPVLVPPNVQRRTSPPPGGPPSRRTSGSTLGVSNLRSSGTMSLGRSAGKQFSSMLQSVIGHSSGYGVSSGYGSSSGYGNSTQSRSRTPSISTPSPSLLLPRSGSLRISNQRKSARARQRDLASDMLASVCLGGKSARGEPEGVESLSSSPPLCSEEPYNRQEAPYDPFCAAEMQMKALLGGSPNLGTSSTYGGSGLIESLDMSEEEENEKDIFEKLESSLRDSDYQTPHLDDYSQKRSNYSDPLTASSVSISLNLKGSNLRGSSPLRSSEIGEAKLISPETRRDRWSTQDYGLEKESSWGMSPSGRTMSSPSTCRRLSDTFGSSRPNNSWRSSSLPPSDSWASSLCSSSLLAKSSYWPSSSSPTSSSCMLTRTSPTGNRFGGDTSSSRYNFTLANNINNRSSSNNNMSSNNSTLSTFAPSRSVNQRNSLTTTDGSISRYPSRHRSSSPEGFDSFKTMRASLEGAEQLEKNSIESLNACGTSPPDTRASSGSSSSESSLPPLSFPLAPSSAPVSGKLPDGGDVTASVKLPRFCHECGHKFPVLLARFCCQCGSKRVSVDA